MPPRRRGPSDEAIDRAIGLIEKGHFVEHACAACAISISTWEKRVRTSEEFALRVAAARAKGEQVHLELARADVNEKRSHAYETWLLERLNPRRYRPPPVESVTRVTVDEQAKSVWDALEAAAERERSE